MIFYSTSPTLYCSGCWLLGCCPLIDLSVEVAGLRFRNPVLTAACPTVRDGERIRRAVEGGAGGVVTKTISTRPALPKIPRPHMAEVRGGFINAELWSELPLERWVSRELRVAREVTRAAGIPLIASVGHRPSEVRRVAEAVADYVDGFEVALAYLKRSSDMAAAVRAAKRFGKPVFAKLGVLPPKTTARVARRVVEAGADALTISDSYGPVLAIDLSTYMPEDLASGNAVMGSWMGFGWLSGPPLKFMAMRMIAEILSEIPGVPVVGVGGVSTGRDALEMFMVGASAVQVCTAAILLGPQIYGRIARQLEALLAKLGAKSLEDVRGLALRKLLSREEVLEPKPPVYYPEKCVGCRLCELSCEYDAIEVVNGKAVLHPDRCFGCGLCVTRCRFGALKLPY